MNTNLYFNYIWGSLDDAGVKRSIREFLDNGVDKFVITDTQIRQMLENEEKIDFLHKICQDFQVSFGTIHAPCGKYHDLNIPQKELREGLIKDHIRSLEIAASFNCRTYTVHIGAAPYCYDKYPLDVLRPLCIEAVEKLVPTAEKLGIVIAVENSFEKPNSAKEVLGIVNHFRGTKAVGVCYDTGHANCMASAPGKDKSKYEPYFPVCWWENGVEWEDGAIQLLKEKIVTCHIHDNDGYGDLHAMPFDGTINWKELMKELFSCPNMIDFQTEVCYASGKNWAGTLLAPEGGYSIRRVVDTFRYLGF
ncbi:MAG: sugar phosphate isomerase/epimerase [Lentisphaeria bacterium]|nr:sugar phosphate isomerase/epimerase [Lentisphaeria bacterium]